MYTDNSLLWLIFHTEIQALKIWFSALPMIPYISCGILLQMQGKERKDEWIEENTSVVVQISGSAADNCVQGGQCRWSERRQEWRRWAERQLARHKKLPLHAVHTSYYSMYHILCKFFKNCFPSLYCRLDDVDPVLFQESDIVSGI